MEGNEQNKNQLKRLCCQTEKSRQVDVQLLERQQLKSLDIMETELRVLLKPLTLRHHDIKRSNEGTEMGLLLCRRYRLHIATV